MYWIPGLTSWVCDEGCYELLAENKVETSNDEYAIYLVAAQYEDMLYLGTQYLSLFSLEGRL